MDAQLNAFDASIPLLYLQEPVLQNVRQFFPIALPRYLDLSLSQIQGKKLGVIL